METYFLSRTLDASPSDAEARAREALTAEGFGVLTEIDLQAKLKEKVGADLAPYKILGACNPPLAHQAVQHEPNVGLMLPCNVIVRQRDDGRTEVAAIDPVASMSAIENDALRDVAVEVRERLARVIEAL